MAITILNYIVLTLLFCLTPAGVIWLCRRYPMLDRVGPIMILYGIGLIVGNIPMPEQIVPLQQLMPNVLIPLAIPMMLFQCSFSRSEAGLQIRVVASGFLSVAISVVVGYLACGYRMAEGAEVGGIISGMYTGGTLNAAALQAIFRVQSETFVLINSYDIIISFLYFVFLFSLGIRLFRRLYGEHAANISEADAAAIDREVKQVKENPYRGMLSRRGVKQMAAVVTAALVVVALSAAVAFVVPEGWFMVVFILLLTTLGVVGSFVAPIHHLDYGYDMGMYLIYIFSMVIASMADFSKLDLVGGLSQILFMSIAVFGSLMLHALFCRVLRVDADSMIISSVAFINSPPFVPMAAAAMRNRRAVITGLAAGIVGYALGNHFGVIMAELLSYIR